MAESSAHNAFIKKMNAALDIISKICFILAGTALVMMTVMFAWLVFGRYVLNDTPTWVEQVSLLLVMVIAFFGAAAGVHQHTHLSVVVFRSIVPNSIRLAFVLISDFLMMVFGGMMFWFGTELTIFKWRALIPLLEWNEGLRSLPLTICGALIFLISIGHIIRVLTNTDERHDSIEQG